MNILIVGAGPTGLTAAVELSRRGHIPVVIDQRDTPSGLSRAVGIQEQTMELLRPSGVADAIAAEAVEIAGVILHRDTEPLARVALGGRPEARLYGLAQDRTEAHLTAALERLGGSVRHGVRLIGLAQDDLGVSVETSAGPEHYDYVIGADGVGSAVRAAAGIEFPGVTLKDRWSIADVDAVDWPDPDWFHGYTLRLGRVVIVMPMAAGRFRVISNTPDALADLPRPMQVTRVHRTDTFEIQIRQVEHYQVGRVFLAGDAAHAHAPVGGRGMNLGMADAADLALRLATGTTGGYSRSSQIDAAHVIAMSERMRELVAEPVPQDQALVASGVGLVGFFPQLAHEVENLFVIA